MGRETSSRSKARVLVQILPLALTSHETGGRLLPLAEPQFFSSVNWG